MAPWDEANQDYVMPTSFPKDPPVRKTCGGSIDCAWGPCGPGCDDPAVRVAAHAERGEVRVVDPKTGGAKGQKLARFDLLPPAALRKVAEHYGRGAAKYEDRNWQRGYAWGLSFGAMQRHAWAFWGGESLDPETKSHHLAAVVFHALALMTFEEQGLGTDDRSPA